MTRKILFNCLLAFLSGTMLYLASPGPHAFPLLVFAGPAPLLSLCRRESPRAAAGYGLLTGLCWYLPLLSFITIVLGTYGGMEPILARLAMVLLALYMSFYCALFAGIFSFCARFFPPLWTAPVLWVALDFLRSFLFTGFPWMDAGYSLFSIPPLIQAASLFGHHGLTFLLVLAAGAIVELGQGKGVRAQARSAIAAVLLLVAVSGGSLYLFEQGKTRVASADTTALAVVQGNIEQNQKWDPDLVDETVRTYERLSLQALENEPEALVIWPETALPFFPLTAPAFSDLLERFVIPNRTWLLTGAPHLENPQSDSVQLFNRAFLITPSGDIAGFYDKQHLVPFGEYVPFRSVFKSFSPVVEAMTDFSSGRRRPPMPCGKLRIGVLICFESIFPELAREQAADGANLLVTITNDAWFGRSNAPWQHLAMGVLRAVETGRSLARAANTGVSCLIDPLGRITATSPLFETWHHAGKLPVLENKTFFVRFGYLFPYLCLALTAGLIAVSWRKRKKEAPNHKQYFKNDR